MILSNNMFQSNKMYYDSPESTHYQAKIIEARNTPSTKKIASVFNLNVSFHTTIQIMKIFQPRFHSLNYLQNKSISRSMMVPINNIPTSVL